MGKSKKHRWNFSFKFQMILRFQYLKNKIKTKLGENLFLYKELRSSPNSKAMTELYEIIHWINFWQ